MIREITLNLRHEIAWALMETIAPKLKTDAKRCYEKSLCNELPRPFTIMLQHTFKNKPLIGAEIGFGYGENAENLLQELNIKKLYCIDPYFAEKPYMDTGVLVDWFCKPSPKDQQRMKRIYEDPRTEFIVADSDSAFQNELIPNELDFIYIDGCHTNDYCLRDITNSMLYVKKGGYVGGHDFANGGLIGVAQAVFTYAKTHDIMPEMVFPDFWFKKEAQP